MNFDKKEMAEIVLSAFSDESNKRNDNGLCFWLGEYLRENGYKDIEMSWCRQFLQELFEEWPEYTGNPNYPIQGYRGESPREAFHTCENHYSVFTCYGRARRRLLKFIKKRCREIIGET